MAKLELSRSLSMSAEQAREHASDLSSLGDWMSMHQGWRSELPDEVGVGTTVVGVGVGTTVVGVAGANGKRNRATWTVRKFDPPSALEISGEGVGGTRCKLAMRVASTGGGCTCTVRKNLGGAPLFCPIRSAAARAVKGDIEKLIEKFEELYT